MANTEFVRREEFLELVLSLGVEVFSLNFSFKETISEIYRKDKQKWLMQWIERVVFDFFFPLTEDLDILGFSQKTNFFI